MSRCFPYPPPGYEAKSRDESLIDTLKLQRERKKEKKEKKKEKREKKEKEKREKGENDKKDVEKKNSNEESIKDRWNQERADHKKRKHEEIEQVERSSVTEEHGQATNTLGFYDSSDSTQTSGKRKKHDVGVVEACHGNGNVLRIRLPLPKRNNNSESSFNRERVLSSSRVAKVPVTADQPSSSGGTSELPSNRDSFNQADYPVKECTTPCEFPTNNKEQVRSISKVAEGPETSGKHRRRILKIESKLRNLLDNWKPPPVQIEHVEFDNQEWLFEKKQCNQVAAQHKGSDILILGTSSLWQPGAIYLPTANVYALPYSVPY